MISLSGRCATLGLGLSLLGCSGDVLGTAGPSGSGSGVSPNDPAGPGDPEVPDVDQDGLLGPPPAVLRRLTLSEYRNSAEDLIGIRPDVSRLTALPPLNGMRAIAASTLALPERDVEVFDDLADSLSAQVFSDATARRALAGCDAQQIACAEQFVVSFGRRAFRRTLTDDERARYLALLATATRETGDGWLGLRVVTSALLQSPAFLYRVELGEPDPADPLRRVLSRHELASRLAYFVWNSAPDAVLLDAAENAALDTSAGLEAQLDRLLASPRAAQASEELFADYLQLDALDTLVKLPEVFPQASPALAAAMKRETLLSLRELLFARAGDFREIFTTTTTFVNAELAALYDLRAPSTGAEFAEVELPANGPRAGLLMQANFLASHAHPARTSPTLRGKFIRENLLCQGIAPPPNNVDTSLPDTSTAVTARERLTEHRENPSCSSCHARMDPLGLALETFDGIGVYRSTDQGRTIDPSGDLDGVAFEDARGLAAALAEHPDTATCFARTLLRYARGALERDGEAALITSLSETFASRGYSLSDLMRAIVTDASFRRVGALQ